MLKLLIVTFVVLPRAAISYAFYSIAPILVINPRSIRPMTSILILASLSVLLLMYILNSFIYVVSPTAAILAAILIFPCLAYLLGASTHLKQIDILHIMRVVSCTILVSSFYHLYELGFPLKLPYVDYSPDEYYALYGIGGGRIVTVLSFLAILVELRMSHKQQGLFLSIAFLNFLIPSYIVGIVCGSLVLMSTYRDKRFVLVLFVALLIPVAFYAYIRLQNINSLIIDSYGYHPKVLGALLIFDMYGEYPSTIFLGSGIGQLTSTPARWASVYLNEMSGNAIPEIPMLFMSEMHNNVFREILSYSYTRFNAISSAMNKPYNSFTTILGEFGLLFGLAYIGLLLRRLFVSRDNVVELSFLAFCLLLFLFDTWHDSPWVGFCLLISTSFRPTQNQIPR